MVYYRTDRIGGAADLVLVPGGQRQTHAGDLLRIKAGGKAGRESVQIKLCRGDQVKLWQVVRVGHSRHPGMKVAAF